MLDGPDFSDVVAIGAVVLDYTLRALPIAIALLALIRTQQTARRQEAAAAAQRDQAAILGRIARLEEDIGADGGRQEAMYEDFSRRLARVETQIEQMPSRDMVHRVELGLQDARGQISGLAQSLSGLSAATTRIEDYLLRGARP